MDFFSESHFNEIISDRQIKHPVRQGHREMIDDLLAEGYEIQTFAGSINSIDDYIEYLGDKSKFKRELLVGQGTKILTGYGKGLKS